MNKNLPGLFFLIVGPSGVGKGTIVSELRSQLENNNDFHFPVTATTRLPREGEEHGKDYFFMSKEDFEADIVAEKFLEYAIVHGENYYGLPKDEIFSALNAGKSIIRELDIQGLWNLQKVLPSENIHSIFLLPPSMKILEKRIRGRSTLPEEEISRRLESARNEIEHSKECNSRVISKENQIKQTVIEVKNIFTREKNLRFHIK